MMNELTCAQTLSVVFHSFKVGVCFRVGVQETSTIPSVQAFFIEGLDTLIQDPWSTVVSRGCVNDMDGVDGVCLP